MPSTAETPLSTSGPTPGRTLIQEGGNREQKTQLANSLKNTGQGGGLSNRENNEVTANSNTNSRIVKHSLHSSTFSTGS